MCELLEIGLKPTFATSNRFKEAYANTGNWKSTLSKLSLMVEDGAMPNVAGIGIATSGWGKARQPEKAFDLFNSMEVRGVKPVAISFNTTISACEKGR